MVNLKYTRPGEGVYIRTFLLIYLLLLSARLALSIYQGVAVEWWYKSLFGVSALGEFGISWGRVISLLTFIILAFLCYIFLNSQKVANFLIETQNELSVVAKPTKKEYLGASIAVLVMVVIMSVYLAVVDSFFTIIFFK
jgi:preprotein translocase SecE subunit